MQGTTYSAADRIQSNGPWVTLYDERAAWGSKSELSGATEPATNPTVNPQNSAAWTATHLGSFMGPACESLLGDSWEANDGSAKGREGSEVVQDAWSDDGTMPCSFKINLYCFEQ